MKDAIFHISLDIDDAYSQANMNLCQGESGRLAAISMRQSGKAFAVEGCRAVCAGTRPDSSVFFIDCTIENGIIFCPFSAVHTAVPGTVKAEIRLYGSKDVLIASPAFSLEIRESAMDDGPIAEGEEATALTALIADTMEAMEAMAAGTITAARVNVDNGVGEPSATVELSPGEGGQTISFAFSNLKGEKGNRGEKGEAGMDGAPGKDGINGKDGMDGRDGVSPAVTLSRSGTVTTLSVTDALGTKTAQIYDGAKGEKGDEGAPGADGAAGKDGADGNAIYAVRDSSTSYSPTFKRDTILNGDRPLQVGDLLLSQYNGYLYQIYELADSTVKAHYTGSTLKGAQGEPGAAGVAGLDGKSIFTSASISTGETSILAFSDIDTGGRTIQLGDLCLAKNGRLYKVTTLYSNAAGVEYTGITMSGGGGGGGADLLNENGIIKQQHLPDGYPYSEMGIGAVLPETSFVAGEDGQITLMGTPPTLTLGQNYTVNWNGAEFTCEALDSLVAGEPGGFLLGNIGLMTGGDDTGEPFIIIFLPAEHEMAQAGAAGGIIPLDGTTEGTLSITGLTEITTPIGRKYLGNVSEPFVVNYRAEIKPNTGAMEIVSADKTYMQIANALANNKAVSGYIKAFLGDDIVATTAVYFDSMDETRAYFYRLSVTTDGLTYFLLHHNNDETFATEDKITAS